MQLLRIAMPYDFSSPDDEDGQSAVTKPMLEAVALPVVMLLGLLVAARFVFDVATDAYFRGALAAFAGALVLIGLFSAKVRAMIATSVNSLIASKASLFDYSFNSFSAFFAALPFIVVRPKARYLPLRNAVLVFKATFLLAFLLAFLFGFPAFLKPYLSIEGFFGCIGELPLPAILRLLAGLLCIPVFLLLLLAAITVPAVGVVFAATLLAWPLARRISQDPSVFEPNVLHVSDLHVTEEGCVGFESERGRSTDEMFAELARRLSAHEYAALVVSGDVTDSGKRKEWLLFLKLVQQLKLEIPVIVAPGNHDLFPYLREYNLYRHSLGIGSRLLRIRKVRYLAAVQALGTPMRVTVDGKSLLLAQFLAPKQGVLESYAVGAGDADALDEIWEQCFPMYCTVGDTAYICIDTNRARSNFYTSAFGELRTDQARRLRALSEQLGATKNIVIVGHHHVYTPTGSWRKDWEAKYLEMLCGASSIAPMSERQVVYLHGHRHYPFQFKLDNLVVRSAPSLRYNWVSPVP
jgi:3',5'-cyclic AMP phosphodiesterase CpdA